MNEIREQRTLKHKKKKIFCNANGDECVINMECVNVIAVKLRAKAESVNVFCIHWKMSCILADRAKYQINLTLNPTTQVQFHKKKKVNCAIIFCHKIRMCSKNLQVLKMSVKVI